MSSIVFVTLFQMHTRSEDVNIHTQRRLVNTLLEALGSNVKIVYGHAEGYMGP